MEITFRSKGFGDLQDITKEVEKIANLSSVSSGIITLFIRGSTTALVIYKNDAGSIQDLMEALGDLAPADKIYKHEQTSGDSNGASHIKSGLLGPCLTIPFVENELCISKTQTIFAVDFDPKESNRSIIACVSKAEV